MTYGKHFENLEKICSEVWRVDDLKDKRNLLRRAVATFKYKEKQAKILADIDKADAKRCDFLASNLMLNRTDKVVDLLPR